MVQDLGQHIMDSSFQHIMDSSFQHIYEQALRMAEMMGTGPALGLGLVRVS